ncbi:coiled-coil domain-containing protein [Legionella saoudiensis]|uniref:hypothetical protein n=1 Tax=Legionella saoudiensis TaxID=1750561 RepID=UPI0007310E4B|nr:hypothetical protein [Legionella saoudiensis]
MNNNKFIKSKIIKMIDNLYRLSGRSEIPDVKKICLETKVDRQTAMKYLCAWRDKCYIKKQNEIEHDDSLSLNEVKDNLSKIMALIECLSKEVALYSDLLNNTPFTFPLGNHILNNLQAIEDQILLDFNYLESNKNLIQKELKDALEENNRLALALLELKNKSAKELRELQKEFDDNKRELLAANQKIKSLKRDKRKISFKNMMAEIY